MNAPRDAGRRDRPRSGLSALSRDEACTLVTPLLKGVQVHLQSPSEPVRRLGMKVAEVVSAVVDPENPLRFDVNEGEEGEEGQKEELAHHDDDGGRDARGAGAAADDAQARAARRERRARRRAARAAAECSDVEEEDPDAPVRLPGASDAPPGDDVPSAEDGSSDDESSDETSEITDGASLPAYDLDDDRTDLAGASRPRHLRQLLSGLRAKDGEHELLTASLEGAAPLIRSAEGGRDLDALATPLAHALLHLTNQYALPSFGSLRHAALVALAVRCPRQLAKYLTAEFYGTNHSLEVTRRT